MKPQTFMQMWTQNLYYQKPSKHLVLSLGTMLQIYYTVNYNTCEYTK